MCNKKQNKKDIRTLYGIAFTTPSIQAKRYADIFAIAISLQDA